MKTLFGPTGPLSQTLPAFEHRTQQAAMAEAVAKVLKDGGTLIVEAGTGTGKTLAYLVPLVLSGRRALVSTGTKNLQEQLLSKDVPVLAGLAEKIRAVCLKGRRNYLCRHRLRQFKQQPLFPSVAENQGFGRLLKWAAATATGDVAEITWLPENFAMWAELSASAEQCLGQSCPDIQTCFLVKARQEAARADLVIVNHHLFFSDLALRARGQGEVIPRCEAYVFDEAHQMEEVACQHFGVSVSSYRLKELATDCLRAAALWSQAETAEIGERIKRLDAAGARLRKALDLEPGRYPWRRLLAAKGFNPALSRLTETLELLRARLAELGPKSEALAHLAARAVVIRDDLALLTGEEQGDNVRWTDVRDRGFVLTSTPMEVGQLFQKHFFEPATDAASPRSRRAVFTSATLAVENGFGYFSRSLGLEKAMELGLASPFDYRTQALLYVPPRMCQPTDEGFAEGCADELLKLLEATRGRALVLFTSHRNLDGVARRLKAADLPWRLLVQGEAPRPILLDRMRLDVHSVLLATASFWEGVDVPGEALSCVVIDRLPFASPGEPLVEARIDRLRRNGKSPFAEYQLPEAVLSFKQGLGRLIRTRQDRGVAAVLDLRLLSKPYGRTFLASLPALPLTRDLEEVRRFLSEQPSA
ncbi:MAG: ATP-dependent DNA helicase [Pseudomonadota bacterium]